MGGVNEMILVARVDGEILNRPSNLYRLIHTPTSEQHQYSVGVHDEITGYSTCVAINRLFFLPYDSCDNSRDRFFMSACARVLFFRWLCLL